MYIVEDVKTDRTHAIFCTISKTQSSKQLYS